MMSFELHSSDLKNHTLLVERFHLPAQVPILEPGSKLQSYRIQAWNYKCLIFRGLDFIYVFKPEPMTKFPIFLQQKIHLKFCNIHIFDHLFFHSLIRQI